MTMQVGGFRHSASISTAISTAISRKAIAFILGATLRAVAADVPLAAAAAQSGAHECAFGSAAYGVLVFVFQQGHFSNLLNFTSNGFTRQHDADSALLYPVRPLDGLRSLPALPHPRRVAAHAQQPLCGGARLEKTGGVITNAALLFMIVTGSFIFTGIVIDEGEGLGMTGRC